MKTTVFFAISGALVAMATPLDLDKRVLKTEVVTDWVTVYVTEGAIPTMYAPGGHHHYDSDTATSTTSTTTSTTSTPTPEAETPTPTPEPQPTSAAPVINVPSPDPTPDSTSAPPPAPEPTTDEAAPAPAATQQAQSAAPSDYASTACYHHNVHRFNHSSPSIAWSEQMAGYAAQLAATCKFAHDVSIGGGGYGQNLAMYATSDNPQDLKENNLVAQAITQMWYNGELGQWPASDYGKDNPDMTNFEGWGHFSQLVWAGSQQVGCKSQYCPPGTMYAGMGAWFTVCNYYPAGNMGGAYGKNVLPPLGQATVTA